VNDINPEPYPGLPQGAFYAAKLPPQASAAASTTDKGVWSTALNLYVNVVDPDTGRTYNGQPVNDVAEGTVHLAAATCRGLATQYSETSETKASGLEGQATKHLTEAVDHIENCSGILDEPLVGPDGEVINGWRLQAIKREDEELARERSKEGDSRHTEEPWATAWRMLAATLLGLLDVLLLWKPLLNLSFESSSGSVFRWAIGTGLAGLQILGIEWAARTYVNKERVSVDRRSAMGDYNRSLKEGRVTSDRPAPDRSELVDADTQLTHAYRALVAIAAFIAIIGGVRVAVLGRRTGLEIYEASLFGAIVGLILGGLVVQMARLYCRGNLLGDRLRIEREAVAGLHERIQYARGRVAEERENALAALLAAEALSDEANRIRHRTTEDYWRAVQLAWTWIGLPQGNLDYETFKQEALPESANRQESRSDLHDRLDRVNQWLADRPNVFEQEQVMALLPAREGSGDTEYQPLLPPADGQLVIYGPRLVDVPVKPAPPHSLMLAGAVVAVVATVATAFLAPGPEGTQEITALATVRAISLSL
jgi:hypothetical protein